ncbi:MAG: exo-alpha-sialidase [Chloroflexi bacterium]|nr:exo-alpha-sialidase [Chloroflexota bacterium]
MALPDGTYRSYIWEPRAGGLVSETSRDGVSFSPDAGVRYALQPDDKGQMGVYDLFVDRSGGVVLLYIGDMFGLNNIRRAYSKDNGWTFTFDRGNILGDATFGGGGRSFVDQKAIVLSDGRIRLFTMKAGTLFSFISADDGRTFSQENFQLRPQDFKEQRLVSLHDPQPVRLPDGRYRIYVTGIVDDGRPAGQSDRNAKQVIVSATTER